MAKKKERLSLKDLKRSDEIEEKAKKINPKNKNHINSAPLTRENNKMATASTTEYEKLSVSIPVETFETLQDISRERRRAKQKHTMSHMVREALTLWLENKN